MKIVRGQTGLLEASERIANGRLVAFPTETVYGLGADACDGKAVAGIYAMKGRPQFNPLISHVLNIDIARKFGTLNKHALKLAEAFWPGPLTIVVPQADNCGISDLVTAGLNTLALRVPEHQLAREFLAQCQRPLAAPSANLSGQVSPTTADHVAADFKDTDLLIVDGGPTGFGIESTIVSCTGESVRLLRPGSVTLEQLRDLLEVEIEQPASNTNQPDSPGQLTSHYATKAHIRLNANEISNDEAFLAFGDTPDFSGRYSINLSETGDLVEAAANLFSALRRLDVESISGIAVSPIPDQGLGLAINDRLRRAAAPRE